jgi:hypothetical protein
MQIRFGGMSILFWGSPPTLRLTSGTPNRRAMKPQDHHFQMYDRTPRSKREQIDFDFAKLGVPGGLPWTSVGDLMHISSISRSLDNRTNPYIWQNSHFNNNQQNKMPGGLAAGRLLGNQGKIGGPTPPRATFCAPDSGIWALVIFSTCAWGFQFLPQGFQSFNLLTVSLLIRNCEEQNSRWGLFRPTDTTAGTPNIAFTDIKKDTVESSNHHISKQIKSNH